MKNEYDFQFRHRLYYPFFELPHMCVFKDFTVICWWRLSLTIRKKQKQGEQQ